jgi:hypothetical protein
MNIELCQIHFTAYDDRSRKKERFAFLHFPPTFEGQLLLGRTCVSCGSWSIGNLRPISLNYFFHISVQITTFVADTNFKTVLLSLYMYKTLSACILFAVPKLPAGLPYISTTLLK